MQIQISSSKKSFDSNFVLNSDDNENEENNESNDGGDMKQIFEEVLQKRESEISRLKLRAKRSFKMIRAQSIAEVDSMDDRKK